MASELWVIGLSHKPFVFFIFVIFFSFGPMAITLHIQHKSKRIAHNAKVKKHLPSGCYLVSPEDTVLPQFLGQVATVFVDCKYPNIDRYVKETFAGLKAKNPAYHLVMLQHQGWRCKADKCYPITHVAILATRMQDALRCNPSLTLEEIFCPTDKDGFLMLGPRPLNKDGFS